MQTHVRAFILVTFAAILTGCATPTTQRVNVTDAATKAEADKQIELAANDTVAEQKRLSRIYSQLSTQSHALCGEQVGPYTGMFALTKPKGDMGSALERHYGIGSRLTVLFVLENSPAERAGLKPRDVLVRVNGNVADDTDKIQQLYLELKPEAPIKLDIERAGTSMSIMVEPLRGCRYPAVINQDQGVNAFADGKRIVVTRGMMNFARDDNELALVLAHEMAHNTMKHMDAKKQNMAVGFLADLAVVLLSRGQVNNTGFANIAASAYSQEFEAEADYVGLYIMANAKLPIEDAPKFWRRMAAANPGNIKTNHAASHPSTSYRMVALEEAVKEISGKVAKGEPLRPNLKDDKPSPPVVAPATPSPQ